MALKHFKNNAAGRRSMIGIDYSASLTPDIEIPARLLRKKSGPVGRNNAGRVTTRHRCSGNKKHYRVIDFKRQKHGIEAKVRGICYDPNRTAFIALIRYTDSEDSFILAPDGLKVGDTIISGPNVPLRVGNALPIGKMREGQQIHAIELNIGQGAKLARTAGGYAKIASLEGKHAQIKMPSGEVRLIPKKCYATLGIVGNLDHMNQRIGKAGKLKYLGRRPQVLGKSMNAVDHPHGGGENHQPVGRKYPVSAQGQIAIGGRTRRNKRSNSMILKRKK